MPSDHKPKPVTGRFTDGSTARSIRVGVVLTDRGVTFEESYGSAPPTVWPYGALSSSVPLSRQTKDVLLTYAYAPGATLFVADAAFVSELRTFAPQLTTASQRWRWAWPLIGVFLLFALFAGAIWASNIRPATTIAGMIPQATRVALGESVVKSMIGTRRVCTEAPGRAALDAMMARLAVGAGGKAFTVTVVDWGLVNAFAAPGGQLVLTRGLIAKASGPDEVAGVMAHELGHAIKLHPESGIVRALGLAAAFELMLGGAGGGTIANVGLLMAQMSYSRDAEREADEVGLDLLRQGAVAPSGVAAFFERMERRPASTRSTDKTDGEPARDRKSVGIGLGDLFSSHPATQERITRARRAPAYPATPALDGPAWAALQRICGVAPPARAGRRPGDDRLEQ